MNNILAIDVEDWYHPEYVKYTVDFKKDRILYSMDAIIQLIQKYDVSPTFFIVGEIAEKSNALLKNLVKNEYEIGFHGFYHEPLYNLNSEKFRSELLQFNELIKTYSNTSPIGYRAPSYSLNNETLWSFNILKEEGYMYDASLFPIKTPLYGVSRVPLFPYRPSLKDLRQEDKSQKIIEFPALVYNLLGFNIPAAGGFYLRLLPIWIIEKAIKKMNNLGYPAVITVHPWELDNDTPKLKLGFYKSFVTYHNISESRKKLESLFCKFKFTSFKNYLENIGEI